MIIQKRAIKKQAESQKTGINKNQVFGEYRKFAKRCQKNMWG